MRDLRTRTSLIVLTAGLAVTLTACGGSDDPSTVSAPSSNASSTPGAAQTVDGISTEHNDADITFITDMTPHHKGAVAMAELAGTRASNPKVKDLAQRILAAQQPELDKMASMAKAWGVTLDDTASGMGGMSGMSGGGMDEDVTALTPLSGAAFDKEFLTRMIAHHEGALPMAQADLDAGVNPQAKTLAQGIITTQKAEITEMKGLLTA